MLRKQVYIDEDLDRGLKTLARATGQPEAVHIRAAVRGYLEANPVPEGDRDPLLDLIGLVDDDDGPKDVAEQHDRYLYGEATAKSSRRRARAAG